MYCIYMESPPPPPHTKTQPQELSPLRLARARAVSLQYVDKYPRTYEYGSHVHICVSSYSKVDAVEQGHVVNLGGHETRTTTNLRTGVGCV
jgi:hypothetical protein